MAQKIDCTLTENFFVERKRMCNSFSNCEDNNSQYIDLFLNESTMQEHLGDCDYKTILRGNNPNCITPNESKVWVNGKDNVSFFERVCGKRNG